MNGDALLPPSLWTWARRSAEGRAWHARLPRLVEECRVGWRLELGGPVGRGSTSLVLAATTPDGDDAVLKLSLPHRESEHEAAALERWAGVGAVRLLAADETRSALLLERARPGTSLAALEPRAALEVLVGLLPRLWVTAAAPFRPLSEEAACWRRSLPEHWQAAGRPFERPLLDAALEALDELPATQGPQVLVSQDLHGANVLAATREPYLAIDPKPLTGEREFSLAPIVRSSELGAGRRDVLYRLDHMTDALGLDRDRARRGCLAQTLAWSFDEGVSVGHVETARRLHEAGGRSS